MGGDLSSSFLTCWQRQHFDRSVCHLDTDDVDGTSMSMIETTEHSNGKVSLRSKVNY